MWKSCAERMECSPARGNLPEWSISFRKRPLDHEQFTVEGDLGTWSNHEGIADLTGPIAFDGKVRARFVADYQDQDYFYNVGSENHTLLYGVVEVDLTPSTLLTVGSSHLQTNTVPWEFGLPRYYDGASLNLPRDTSLAFPWNWEDLSTTELFVRLEQRINDDWSVRLNTSRVQQSTGEFYDFVEGPIVQTDQSGAYAYGYDDSYNDRQYMGDLTLNGAFQLFGRRQELVMGGRLERCRKHRHLGEESALLPGGPDPKSQHFPVRSFGLSAAACTRIVANLSCSQR